MFICHLVVINLFFCSNSRLLRNTCVILQNGLDVPILVDAYSPGHLVLTKDYNSDGGLKMINLQFFCKSLKITWIRRLGNFNSAGAILLKSSLPYWFSLKIARTSKHILETSIY